MTATKKSPTTSQIVTKRVAFQGAAGAYSHLACQQALPDHQAVPCHDFEESFGALASGEVSLAMIPIDNSIAGRVADIHHLLPESGMKIIGEHFQPVKHCLLGKPGATLDQITHAHCHLHTVGQVRKFVRKRGIKTIVAADNAGAAEWLSTSGTMSDAAIASSLAGELYGLETLATDINDDANNTTRFVILSRDGGTPINDQRKMITSFVFRTRSVPAALYKALGGFATNGVNMTKLESYILDASFHAVQFYADVEGHVEDRALENALEELRFYCADLNILGSYPASSFRTLSN